MNLTELAIKKPVTTIMIFISFIVIGSVTLKLIPLEFLPNFEFPYVEVYVPYPNSSPEEIEKQITKPVEEILSTISNIKNLMSNTKSDYTWIGMEFDWGVNATMKSIETKEKIDSIRNLLPQDIRHFYIYKYSSADDAFLELMISSERDLSDSYDFLDRNIKRKIERINGIAKVELYGTFKRPVKISLKDDRIKAHQVDLNRLGSVLAGSNFVISAGQITDNNKKFSVRSMGKLSKDEFGDLIINETDLRLSDVADVTYELPKIHYKRHLNKKYTINLEVYKEPGANIVEISRKVKAELAKIKKKPVMADIDIFSMHDSGQGVLDSLFELLKAGILGFLLSTIILFIFLRQWQSTLIVALSVPFSMFVTIALMYFSGLSLNIVTMTGVLVAVGMVVDNSVVVTENIYRNHKLYSNKDSITIKASKEVALAITAGTLTTVIVFLPNIISQSDETTFYLKHVGLSFSFALVTSLVVAQTIVPLLTTKIKSNGVKKTTWLDKLSVWYKSLLNWLLNHRYVSILMIFILLGSVTIPLQLINMDMFPSSDGRILRLRYNINDSYTIEKVEEAVKKVEDYLMDHKEEFEIENLYTSFHGSYARSKLYLYKDIENPKSITEIQDLIKKGMPEIAVGKPAFQRIRSGGGKAINILLYANSTEPLIEASKDISWTLSNIDNIGDIQPDTSEKEKEVRVVIDRERARALGLSPDYIAQSIQIAMRGINLSNIQDDDTEIEVEVSYQKDDKQTIDDLKTLTLFNDNGDQIPLESVVNFVKRESPSSIWRENRKTSLVISIDKGELTVNDAKEKIHKIMSSYKLPYGVTWDYGQGFRSEDNTEAIMMFNTLLALGLIYFVMAALFESILFPGAIWVSIVFAVVGVFWFFFITVTTFSIMAWIGVLVLIGVVVNNGIVLIDRLNQLREKGLSRHDAIVQAGGDRMRPILMTAGTTILSLVPLCFSSALIGGEGGPPYYPMARAIVGGLLLSTFVTLVILPTIYVLIDEFKLWMHRILKKAQA